MTEFGLDLDPRQIVHWLKDDLAAGRRRKLDLRAMREYATEPVAHPEEAGIGEDEEVASLVTVGTLEVRPVDVAHRWVLRVRVEDVVGGHLPDDESVPEDAEEIGLDAFFTDFIAPDRGTVAVTLEAETAEARHAFDRILAELVTDRHGS